jgi:hypothetical protein
MAISLAKCGGEGDFFVLALIVPIPAFAALRRRGEGTHHSVIYRTKMVSSVDINLG